MAGHRGTGWSASGVPSLTPTVACQPRRCLPGLVLVTSLVAVMLQEAGPALVPQVSVKFKGEKWLSEQDTKEAWGARAVQPPEKDSLLSGLPSPLKPHAATTNVEEKPPGAKPWVDGPWPQALPSLQMLLGPEEDLDSLYHPPPEEDQGVEGPWAQALPSLQVLLGPEEDRDHIYHPAGP
ncbi:proline-rich acidic protein 1 [Trichechus manatus latirostris]|uniref:Proline-rich acidic protein 1 n=1 Tax=Trichechus manatus latirostris TaxID=127582 RepID=A0A2Y9FZJ5_TRIMA|nr:proline-rich acidic protein 1 [Trichechus manatus latirostris]